MMEKIRQYKQQVVLVGFAIGALGYFNILPEKLPLIGDFSKIFYAGLVGLAAYTFWTFYANAAPVPIRRPIPKKRRTPPPIKRKPDTFQKFPETQGEQLEQTPSDRIFEEFHKD
jgi:hypothetical protein